MNPDIPLYERDPQAWQEYLAEGNAKQPRKRVGADALIRDEHGRLLLVDPKYKPDWDIPGGMAEANEPPLDAVLRELHEEPGLLLPASELSLRCLDWVSPHGVWDDSLMFIFDAGALSEDQVADLRLTDSELAAFEFCTAEQAQERLRPYIWSRVSAAIEASKESRVFYLHNGVPV
ncbi:NUDIX hydrolase [Nocardia fusca]|uniref:NUDIX hydrolase n=2 Tax=Nocardia fusca TaxID=941183 RepID=A0ABV3FEY3_9NOCA